MTLMAPKNKWELSDMMKFAIKQKGPVAIRYPRGEAYDGLEDKREPIVMGKGEVLYSGKEIAILAVGSMVKTAVKVKEQLEDQGLQPTIVNMRFVKPLDTQLLDEIAKTHSLVITMEENVKNGGFGEKILHYFNDKEYQVQVRIVAIEDQFVSHGSVDDLMKHQNMDADSVTKRILNWKK